MCPTPLIIDKSVGSKPLKATPMSLILLEANTLQSSLRIKTHRQKLTISPSLYTP